MPRRAVSAASLPGMTLFSGIPRLRKYKRLPSSTLPHSRKALSLFYFSPALLVQPAKQYPPTAPDTVSSGQGVMIEDDASAIAAAEAGIRSPGYVCPENKNTNS